MKIGFKLSILTATAGLLLSPLFTYGADDKKADDNKSGLTSEKDKVSYSIGMNIGRNLKRGSYDVDVEVLSGAIKDMLAGKEPKLTDAQAQEIMMAYQKELRTKQDEERVKLAEKNRKAGEEFLAQ